MSQARAGNRRGRRSRQEILDAAARVMSVRGYAGTSISTLVKETGLPKSAFYHHFESKAGLLSAVMAQGAQGFFEAMRDAHREPPEHNGPRERLGWYLRRTGEVFVHREEFLRLLLVLVMSHEAAEAPEAQRTVSAVRDEGRDYMRHMIRSSFLSEGEDAANRVADALAHFGMAGFDGAFVSLQSADGKPMAEFMSELTDAMATMGEALIAGR
ncbi:TetR/AcrR family transcriptional regulator [Spongiactinospora sp. TRM90649]|uniref:TetR/AcrR family transcriptional regulator n=1 Tax=Spongiactinospora sp. TRM90649 TaxID=3031114 RepID=UPI0023F67379|nr:TetR/AcrR family transcriptional regulator [Spongiactinospora sp. TRM90649]MDF5754580.1 TetR/AcrR family transcriptional regulator [Spongiactinospora sp. TRM90649]